MHSRCMLCLNHGRHASVDTSAMVGRPSGAAEVYLFQALIAQRRAGYVGRCVVRPAGLRLRPSIGLKPQPLALSEDTMRVLLQFITMTLLIAASSFAYAQSAFIQVEQPWSRATPAGARTGAVYLTVTNKSHIAYSACRRTLPTNRKFTR
jgi:hypothetical protein